MNLAILVAIQSNHSKNQPSQQPLNQTILRTSYLGSHSIKPFEEPAILASTQSNHSKNQASWHPLNQTILRNSHPGSHSIKPASESWRPVGRLKGWVWWGRASPGKKWRRRRRRRPNNSPRLVRPLGHHVQGPNIPCGESLTSIYAQSNIS